MMHGNSGMFRQQSSFAGMRMREDDVMIDVEMMKLDKEDSSEGSSASDVPEFVMKSWGQVPPVELAWDGLSCSVNIGRGKKKQTKMLLNNISGCARPGELLAIMGASGAGKTTLLNVLSGRTTPSMKLNGNILINGEPMNLRHFKESAGFVTQEDIMHSFLTVKEVITFSALMRLPASMAYSEKMRRVDDVVAQLGLRKCQNTRVGNSTMRGISGGEKKRVNVGTELVKNPSVLFLDEPTSGLDAFTSLNLLSLLKQIAQNNGQTIVCTIHQPRAAIFNMFDKLMLLGQGETVYFGPAQGAVSYFAEAGFPCPQFENPADFFLDVTTPDNSSPEAAAARMKQIKQLTEHYKEHHKPLEFTKGGPPPVKIDRIGFFVQLLLLTHRALRCNLRDYLAVLIRLVSSLIIGIIIGFTWLQLKNTDEHVIDRNGFLFFSVTFVGFCELDNALSTFPAERDIFLQERASGFYKVLPYFVSKLVADLPVLIAGPILFSVSSYFMVGLLYTANDFFAFLGALWLISWVMSSLGLFISAANRSFQAAVAIGNVTLVFTMLYAGFLINPKTIPGYFIWLHWISPIKYGFAIIANSQWHDGLKIKCDHPESCMFHNGTEVMDYLRVNIDTYPSVLVMVGQVLLIYVLTYAALRFLNKRS